jgi:hypothetical protein
MWIEEGMGIEAGVDGWRVDPSWMPDWRSEDDVDCDHHGSENRTGMLEGADTLELEAGSAELEFWIGYHAQDARCLIEAEQLGEMDKSLKWEWDIPRCGAPLRTLLR